jgi:AcrR family transcriptional regulator
MSKKTMSYDERRNAAIAIGVQFAKKVGAANVSVASVAAKQGVSGPMLFNIFGSRKAFTDAIVKAAKKSGATLPALGTKKAAPAKKTAPPVKKAAPVAAKKPAPAKKVAALLKPKKAAAAPKKAAEKFKALPTPFEASVAAVAG